MFNLFKRKRQDNALIAITQALQTEEAMMLNSLARQVEERLKVMSPDEALKAIAILRREK